MSEQVLEEVKKVSGAVTKAREEMIEKLGAQQEELQKHGETTDATAKELKQAEQKLDQALDDLKGHEERMSEVEKRLNRPGSLGGGDVPGHKKCTPGEQFVLSDQYNKRSKSGRAEVDAVEVRSLFHMEQKDITNADNSAGALIDEMRVPEIFRDPADRMVHLRDVMGINQTMSDAIEYVTEYDGFINNAASQANQFDEKAKSELTFDLKTEAVRTIAHWIPASRQVLDDAPMLRGYIDGRLLEGLLLEEDNQILYGDGSSGTLNGILNNALIQDIGNTGDVDANDTRLDHIRRAIAQGRLSNYQMNGILVNPADWADLELQKGSDDHYIWVTVPNGGEPRLWRVPVIETNAIESGDFLVGNWNLAATLWDRQRSSVRVSESHADFFIKNGVAILAEERLALTTHRPQAFVKGEMQGLT
jgi:HK97 family phage major capsid protein